MTPPVAMGPTRLPLPTDLTLELQIGLSPDLSERVPKLEAPAPVQAFADGLVEDLALPVRIATQLVPAASRRSRTVELSLAGVPLRAPPMPAAWDGEMSALVAHINSALYSNRELFVGPAVVDELWRQWTAQTPCPGDVRKAVAGFVALRLSATHARALAPSPAAALPLGAPDPTFERELAEAARFVVLVSPALQAVEAPNITPLLHLLSDELFTELGLILPAGTVQADQRLGASEFRVQLNDVRLPVQIWFNADNVLAHARIVVRQAAESFLTKYVTDFYTDKLAEAAPNLVACLKHNVSDASLPRILRYLLHEGISIRDLVAIFESLLAVTQRMHVTASGDLLYLDIDTPVIEPVGFGAGREAQARGYAESVRRSLKRWISAKYATKTNVLTVYCLSEALERRFRDPRPLDRDEHAELTAMLSAAVATQPPAVELAVILTGSSVRTRMRCEIEKEFPDLPVMAVEEVAPEMQVQTIATIGGDSQPRSSQRTSTLSVYLPAFMRPSSALLPPQEEQAPRPSRPSAMAPRTQRPQSSGDGA